LAKNTAKQFIYIVQASLEPSKCKIGITNDLKRRLKEYNNMTGKSKENIYQYLFTCEVKNMAEVENDIKEKYNALREEKNKEIYFYNSVLFEDYVKFIKSHKLFVKEIFIKTDDKKQTVIIIKKTTPSLKERGLTRYDIMQKAQKANNDEFFTRYEDDPLSIKILNEEADIVCTNPPFSRAIEYWKLLINSGKRFIIISNESNAVTTAFIPYFKDNKVWAGYNSVYWYLNPKKEIVRAAGRWYTNIKIKNRETFKRLKIMPLKEIPDKHKKYDDTKILLVDNGYIPSDYNKMFAVSSNPILNGLLEKGYKIVQEKKYNPHINGNEKFARVLVQKI